ncbi:hypothetical protein C8T65DRAFT_630991 [Cerioporus squamosus]|nr:hypothetical protein C8T65DRAFT_630991 [Cerioporus squamosus]
MCIARTSSSIRHLMEIIPKPPTISRRIIAIDQGLSLADQMKLTGSRANMALYFDIVNTLGILCNRYLPYQRDMHKLAEAKSTLMEEVKRRYPCLEGYEDDWPLKVMITQHRQLQRSGGRGLVRSAHEIESIKQSMRDRKNTTGCVKSKSRKRSSRNASTPARSVSQKGASVRNSQKENAPVPKSRFSTLETISGATVVSDKQPHEAILRFLRNLAQNLSFLLPVFVRYGVTDRSSLRSIRCMENWRAWLYTWVKEGTLTELQFKMVTDGMEKIV